MSLFASLTNLFSGGDLFLILLVILLLFGAKKLPELARGMGQAMREFQKAKDEFSDELHKADQTDTAAAKPAAQPAQSTVPRIENSPAPGAPQANTSQTSTPSDTAGQA
jgi:sec-independent protein translocase protein TatA